MGPDGYRAITTEDGGLRISNPAGTPSGEYRTDPPEPMLLVSAPADSPKGVTWVTLARRNQVLRGHNLAGGVIWESPVPWDGWAFHAIGPLLVVCAADGRSVAFDGSGHA